MEHDLPQQTLVALFTLRSEGQRCNAGTLATILGVRRRAIASALIRLETDGLVDPTKLTLTMRGLAVAVCLRATSRLRTSGRAAHAA